MTRRSFAALLSTPLAHAAGGWENLFDGTLNGWTASENKASWKIIDGALAADGRRSHLFYSGPVEGADFKNFELEAEVMAQPGANSGIYFHTAFQDRDFPRKGFEVQVNNTASGEGSYRERKKTGSLYGLRNVYKQVAPDGQWFKIHALVRGKNIQVRVGGMLVVDYTEPTPPYIPKGLEPERFLDHGTFALQCHDAGSKARFRSIRVRPLPGNATAPGATALAADDTFRDLIELGRANIPLIDFDVEWKGGLKLEQALAASRRDGAARGITLAAGDDGAAVRFAASLKNSPAFSGLRAGGAGWARRLSRETASRFDYILADATAWMGDTQPAHAEQFLDSLADRTASILDSGPLDICTGVLALPKALARDRETLWTEPRLRKIFAALARNGVAMDLAGPAAAIRLAKEMGVRFVFGAGMRGIALTKESKLAWTDFWLPGGFGPKAAERKSGEFRA